MRIKKLMEFDAVKPNDFVTELRWKQHHKMDNRSFDDFLSI